MGAAEDIQLFDQLLGELIVKYEQYFTGIEKREPLQLRDEVGRLSRKLIPAQIFNTGLRFRYNSLVAKFVTYQQHWDRTIRLIEEGKYSRDRFLMKLHDSQRAGSRPKAAEKPPKESGDERLYREYLAARKQCNLSVEGITLESIRGALEKQKPLLAQKYGCVDVQFKVVVEEGKPKIKARPVK